MKAFDFKLQTKLNVSSRQEELAKEELHLRLAKCQEIENNLSKHINKLLELEENIRKMMKNQGNIQIILLGREYTPTLKKHIDLIRKQLLQAEEKAEKARFILIEKAKETKVLKKLRDKEWLLYLMEAQKEEQKFIDETAINNHYQKNGIKKLM